jgi:hypothetical protein
LIQRTISSGTEINKDGSSTRIFFRSIQSPELGISNVELLDPAGVERRAGDGEKVHILRDNRLYTIRVRFQHAVAVQNQPSSVGLPIVRSESCSACQNSNSTDLRVLPFPIVFQGLHLYHSQAPGFAEGLTRRMSDGEDNLVCLWFTVQYENHEKFRLDEDKDYFDNKGEVNVGSQSGNMIVKDDYLEIQHMFPRSLRPINLEEKEGKKVSYNFSFVSFAQTLAGCSTWSKRPCDISPSVASMPSWVPQRNCMRL